MLYEGFAQIYVYAAGANLALRSEEAITFPVSAK